MIKINKFDISKLDIVDIISEFANDNKKLEKHLTELPEDAVLQTSMLILLFENKIKKLLLCAFCGKLNVFQQLKSDFYEFQEQYLGAIDNLEELCEHRAE